MPKKCGQTPLTAQRGNNRSNCSHTYSIVIWVLPSSRNHQRERNSVRTSVNIFPNVLLNKPCEHFEALRHRKAQNCDSAS